MTKLQKQRFHDFLYWRQIKAISRQGELHKSDPLPPSADSPEPEDQGWEKHYEYSITHTQAPAWSSYNYFTYALHGNPKREIRFFYTEKFELHHAEYLINGNERSRYWPTPDKDSFRAVVVKFWEDLVIDKGLDSWDERGCKG